MSFERTFQLLIEKDYLDQPQQQTRRVQFEQDLAALQSSLIKMRDEQVQRTSQEVSTVHDIFRDFSFLVDDQSESIEDLVINCDRSEQNIEQGVVEIHQASYQREQVKQKHNCGSRFGFGLAIGGFFISATVATIIILVKKLNPKAIKF